MPKIFLPEAMVAANFNEHLRIDVKGVPSSALDFDLLTPSERAFPRLVPSPNRAVPGTLVEASTDDAGQKLDFFAKAVGLTTASLSVSVDGGTDLALAITGSEDRAPNTSWNADWIEIWRVAGAEIMSYFNTLPADVVANRLPVILGRAWSRVMAARDARASLSGFTRRDVDVVDFRRPYSAFFTVEEYSLSHSRFDGRPSDVVERAVFVAVDAVTVLPYDPSRDRVLMVEQIRMSPLARGDCAPWLLEPVAGRIEPGQSPEEAAHREAEEEAGLKLKDLIKVADYYPSTGCFSEYVHSYVGLADLPDDAAGLGGLMSEGEDIRAHVFERKEMMDLIAKGFVPDAPALLTAFWLQANLARLRGLG